MIDKAIKKYVIPEGIIKIPTGAFRNLTELEEITIPDSVTEIGAYAFSGCTNLKSINLSNVKSIGEFAFKNCDNITSIYIPDTAEYIAPGALSYMHSLESIKVSNKCKRYITYDNLSLMDKKDNLFIQYAIGSKEKVFKIQSLKSNAGISKSAFAGCKNLKQLSLDTSIVYIDKNAFDKCDNLTLLDIQASTNPELKFTITKNNVKKNYNNTGVNDYHNASFPFEAVRIENGITSIGTGCFAGFKNLKDVLLPKHGLVSINHESFSKCKKLKMISVSKNINSVRQTAFNPKILFVFNDGYSIKNSDFLKTCRAINEEFDYTVFKHKNYNLYQKKNCQVIVSNKYVENKFKNPEMIFELADTITNYIALLSVFNKNYKVLKDGIFVRALYQHIPYIDFQIDDFIEEGTRVRFDDPDELAFEWLKFLKNKEELYDLSSLCNETYLATLLIKYFDSNTKRMINLSKVLEDSDSAETNLNDLLRIGVTLGIVEDDSIIRQRALTFINDNVLTTNGKEPNITGDDIHRIFCELTPRKEFDYKFAKFFMENYQKIYEREQNYPGFISRTYENFPEIVETFTSDNGRELLMTFEKVCNYAVTNKFQNVDEESLELATLLACWYDDNNVFGNAKQIVKESESLPRNLFTNNNNPTHDLKEEINEKFSYEWLPKQSILNLILGKYCNCCAHINGNGLGIVRASMTSPFHQNMAIKNEKGKIIGKSTIYINPDEGYAVFNNVESNMKYKTEEDLTNIYNAFMRGANAFLNKYNENNPDKPINIMTIGTSRNTVKTLLMQNEIIHPINDILETPSYSNYSIDKNGRYKGDSLKEQRLVLKK